MGTSAFIAVKNQDGTIDSVYCSYDGYPSHTGDVLVKWWNTSEKVKSLIALGSIVALEADLESTESYHKNHQEDIEIFSFKNESEFFEGDGVPSCEYYYIYDSGHWKCFLYNGKEIPVDKDVDW
jgi:hypothetical protein